MHNFVVHRSGRKHDLLLLAACLSVAFVQFVAKLFALRKNSSLKYLPMPL
jgi:hypothetical protein